MKKDYIPVKNSGRELSESGYLKQYWTSQWEGQEAKFDIPGMYGDEKYKIIKKYLKALPASCRVLDGGCGLGQWTFFLEKQGFKAVGLDISWQTLCRLTGSRSRSASFLSADVRRLPFRDDYFDLYMSWGTFEHFENGLGGCIEEGFRILKPGGLLCLSVPYQNWRHIIRDSQPLQRWDENYNRREGYVFPMRFYQWRLRPRELYREVKLAGFDVLNIAPIDKKQGIIRMMHHEFEWFKPKTFPYIFISGLLSIILPSGFVAHMLVAIAKKPHPAEVRGSR